MLLCGTLPLSPRCPSLARHSCLLQLSDLNTELHGIAPHSPPAAFLERQCPLFPKAALSRKLNGTESIK